MAMSLLVRRISAYALVLCGNSVLLSKLNRGPNAGKWNLIGGGIDHGEDPIAALKREAMEEAGITIEDRPQLLTVLSKRYLYINHENIEEDFHLIGIIYVVRLPAKVEGKIDNDNDSSDECRWFNFKDLDSQNTVPFVAQSLALLQ